MKALEYFVMAKQDDYIKTALRLPRELHAAIQASAEDRRCSMNAEIIDRLTRTFVPEGLSETIADQLGAKSQAGGTWHSQDIADQKRDEAVYGVLVKVADTLSEPERTADGERNLLAEVIRLMAKLRDKYYWYRH